MFIGKQQRSGKKNHVNKNPPKPPKTPKKNRNTALRAKAGKLKKSAMEYCTKGCVQNR